MITFARRAAAETKEFKYNPPTSSNNDTYSVRPHPTARTTVRRGVSMENPIA
jgi:hypothetical protein